MNLELIMKINECLSLFETDEVRNFAEKVVKELPDYIWEIPASSTSKYHPAYALGVGGLMRHQIATFKFMNNMLSIDQHKNEFTEKERDCLRLAALVHDGRKSGSQQEFLKNKYTNFDHPLKMAEAIRNYSDLPKEDIEFIATTIESHMGQWNVDRRSDCVLPVPQTEAQKLLHLADYLASRKEITVEV